MFDAELMKNLVNLDTLVLMKKSHMIELPYDPHGPTRFWLLVLGNNSRMRTTRDGVSKEGKSEEKEKVY